MCTVVRLSGARVTGPLLENTWVWSNFACLHAYLYYAYLYYAYMQALGMPMHKVSVVLVDDKLLNRCVGAGTVGRYKQYE